jgi:nitrate reductase gamma subunit
MSGLVVLAVAYVSLLVFAAVAVYRTVKIARLPVHLRWELAPVPHEKGKGSYGGSYLEEYEWWTKPRERSLAGELSYMAQEIVFLKAVWEHNRRLWWFSFPMHLGIYLLVVCGALALLAAVLERVGAPSSVGAALHGAMLPFAAAGYTLGLAGSVGLLVSRLTDPRLQVVRTGISLLNLGFLAAVFLSGGAALIGPGEFSDPLTSFARALLTGASSIDLPGALAAHLVLVFLFLAYLPFTQMLHFMAKYFTYHWVRWDDQAMAPNSRIEREVIELLKQPVTWSGAHVKADGRKHWVDIVTDKNNGPGKRG